MLEFCNQFTIGVDYIIKNRPRPQGRCYCVCFHVAAISFVAVVGVGSVASMDRLQRC